MNAISNQTALWLRFIYVISALPATVTLAFLPLPRRLLSASRCAFDTSYFILFILSRALFFGVVFFVLHFAPRGDVVGYYYPEAHRALEGALVYRDFVSSYAPLFSYIGAGILRLADTPLTLIAFTIMVDICSVPVWFAVIRPSSAEATFRRGALLYLVQPLLLFNVAIDGGNNTWIALSLALALLFLARRRDALSGASYSISLVLVKFLPLIFAPILFLNARRRLAWAGGVVLPMLAVFVPFAAKHANIFQPLQQEGNLQLGGSLPQLCTYMTGIDVPGRIPDAITVLVLLACTLLWWRITSKVPSPCLAERVPSHESLRSWETSLGVLVLTLLMLILSKKSWTIYIIMVMFPFCQLVVRHGRFTRFLYCLMSFLLIVEPSFLFDKVGIRHQPIHLLLRAGDHDAWLLMAMYIVELICFTWFIGVAVQDVRRRRSLTKPVCADKNAWVVDPSAASQL